MKLTNTLVYECGCSIPMAIEMDFKTVKVNGSWAYESVICDKHSKQVIELGNN